MRKRKSLRFCLLVAAAGTLICTGASAADADAELRLGKKLFTQAVPACSICHTLKDAGAQGEVGPQLDEIKPDAARVTKALRNGLGNMPAFKNLSEAEVRALSRYVATATGATP